MRKLEIFTNLERLKIEHGSLRREEKIKGETQIKKGEPLTKLKTKKRRRKL